MGESNTHHDEPSGDGPGTGTGARTRVELRNGEAENELECPLEDLRRCAAACGDIVTCNDVQHRATACNRSVRQNLQRATRNLGVATAQPCSARIIKCNMHRAASNRQQGRSNPTSCNAHTRSRSRMHTRTHARARARSCIPGTAARSSLPTSSCGCRPGTCKPAVRARNLRARLRACDRACERACVRAHACL